MARVEREARAKADGGVSWGFAAEEVRARDRLGGRGDRNVGMLRGGFEDGEGGGKCIGWDGGETSRLGHRATGSIFLCGLSHPPRSDIGPSAAPRRGDAYGDCVADMGSLLIR